jgi:hypothetical protein
VEAFEREGEGGLSVTTRRRDTTELEERVKRMYQEVALEPEHEFHFETGRPLAGFEIETWRKNDDRDHPEMERSDEQIWARIEADAYEVENVS